MLKFTYLNNTLWQKVRVKPFNCVSEPVSTPACLLVSQSGRRAFSEAGEVEGQEDSTQIDNSYHSSTSQQPPPPRYWRSSVNTPLIKPHVRHYFFH